MDIFLNEVLTGGKPENRLSNRTAMPAVKKQDKCDSSIYKQPEQKHASTAALLALLQSMLPNQLRKRFIT
uniref:Uncharacterized protein n=1 Tax=Ditylenchus dipsaci TaxID=166011 RepID=A0A915E1C6_9BILA